MLMNTIERKMIMSYGFNDNTYKVLKNCRWYDIFDRRTRPLTKGELIGSGVANQIIADEDTDNADNGQPYIDKMVELGYISLETAADTGGFTAISANNNYLDTGIVPNQNTILKVWGNYNSTDTFTCIAGTRGSISGNDRFYIAGGAFFNGNFGFGWNVTIPSILALDTNSHIFELNNGQLLIDTNIVGGTSGTVLTLPDQSILLLALNAGGVQDFSDFTISKSEIIHNGQTHVWDFNAIEQRVDYTIDGITQPNPTIQGTILPSQWKLPE